MNYKVHTDVTKIVGAREAKPILSYMWIMLAIVVLLSPYIVSLFVGTHLWGLYFLTWIPSVIMITCCSSYFYPDDGTKYYSVTDIICPTCQSRNNIWVKYGMQPEQTLHGETRCDKCGCYLDGETVHLVPGYSNYHGI